MYYLGSFFIIHVLTSGKIVDYICKVSSIKTKVVHGKHKQNSKHVIYISFGFFLFLVYHQFLLT